MRLAAFLIDYFVLIVFAFFIQFIISGASLLVVIVLVWWFYFALLESSSRQATLGQRLVGIMVTDLAGGRISFGRATGRFFAKLLSGLAGGLGFLVIGGTPRKQGWHDTISGCLVIRGQPNQPKR